MTLSTKFGFLCILVVAFQIVKSVRCLLCITYKKQLRLQPDVKELGKWAVIAGLQGLGRAYAKAFAARGMNIILLGYSEVDLLLATKEISMNCNVETKFFILDLAYSKDAFKFLEKEFNNYEIGILVNCIELSYPYPELFIDVPYSNKNFRRRFNNAVFSRIINTNLYPVTHLCRIVLKGMYERKKGIIINVSSTLAEFTCPMLAVYAASKAYISKFTADLSAEYYNDGIIVQCLQPGFVDKRVNHCSILSWLRPTPEAFVESSILSLGISDKTCGFILHSVLLLIYSVAEKLLKEQTRSMVRAWMEETRRRAIVRKYGRSSSECIHISF